MKKHMTNEEFISDLMNYSRFGALSQMAVIQLLQVGINTTLEAKESEIKKAEENEKKGIISFVNMKSYMACVEDIKERFHKMYGN